MSRYVRLHSTLKKILLHENASLTRLAVFLTAGLANRSSFVFFNRPLNNFYGNNFVRHLCLIKLS